MSTPWEQKERPPDPYIELLEKLTKYMSANRENDVVTFSIQYFKRNPKNRQEKIYESPLQFQGALSLLNKRIRTAKDVLCKGTKNLEGYSLQFVGENTVDVFKRTSGKPKQP